MFLGYSEADETMLRPHNNLTVRDAVHSLDKFMREQVNNQVMRYNRALFKKMIYTTNFKEDLTNSSIPSFHYVAWNLCISRLYIGVHVYV